MKCKIAVIFLVLSVSNLHAGLIDWVRVKYLVATQGTANHENWLGWTIDAVPTEGRRDRYMYPGHENTWLNLIDRVPDDKSRNINQVIAFVHENVNTVLEPVYLIQGTTIEFDNWQRASDTLRLHGGDCEDIAVICCALARQNGYNVRVALGYKKIGKRWAGHAWNIWINDKERKIYIIDVGYNVFIDSRYVTDYLIDHSFDDKNIYAHEEIK